MYIDYVYYVIDYVYVIDYALHELCSEGCHLSFLYDNTFIIHHWVYNEEIKLMYSNQWKKYECKFMKCTNYVQKKYFCFNTFVQKYMLTYYKNEHQEIIPSIYIT